MRFSHWVVTLFFIAPFIILCIFLLFDQLINMYIPFMKFFASEENARAILSSMSQVQITVLSIFLAAYFILIQMHPVPPYFINKAFRSPLFLFTLFINLLSILIYLIFIRYVDIHYLAYINIFWFFSLFVFGNLLLIPFMKEFLNELYDIKVKDEAISGHARYDLEELQFIGTHAPEINLERKNLKKANFTKSVLTMANMKNSDLRESQFFQSNLNDSNLVGTKLSNSKIVDSQLLRANLNDSEMSRIDLRDSNLRGASLVNTIIDDSNLENAKMDEVLLNGAHLRRSNLDKISLVRSNLQSVDLEGATLRDAKICEADLSGANLNKTDLSNADLAQANLTRTSLVNANLYKANLTMSMLIKSNLIGSNFLEANLFKAALKEVNYDEKFLISLLSAINIENADMDHELRASLIKKGTELLNYSPLDLHVKESLGKIQKMQEKIDKNNYPNESEKNISNDGSAPVNSSVALTQDTDLWLLSIPTPNRLQLTDFSDSPIMEDIKSQEEDEDEFIDDNLVPACISTYYKPIKIEDANNLHIMDNAPDALDLSEYPKSEDIDIKMLPIEQISPELPDAEVSRRFIERTSLNKIINDVIVKRPGILKDISVDNLIDALTGNQFISTLRHGSNLFIRTEKGPWLIFQFGKNVSLRCYKDASQEESNDRLILTFHDGSHLSYNSFNIYSWVSLTSDPYVFIRDNNLGDDLLELNLDLFKDALKKAAKRTAKSALMDQHIVADLGTLYSDEVLFQASIHPSLKVESLGDKDLESILFCIASVMKIAISSLADITSLPDSFLLRHLPPDGDGICPKDGAKLSVINVSGRLSFYCPFHQKSR